MEIRFLDQKIEMEGQEIFDLKPLTKEEIAYFIDFAREQYLVRWDDMKEAHNVRRNYRDRISVEIGWENRVIWGKMVKIIERAKNRKVACRSGPGNPSLIPHHRDRYPGSRNLYI